MYIYTVSFLVYFPSPARAIGARDFTGNLGDAEANSGH
jgi:hypothetical protein